MRDMANKTRGLKRRDLAIGLAVAFIFVALGVFLLSESLETLDVQAEEMGLVGYNILASPFPEYVVPGFEDVWGTLLLGLASTVMIFMVAYAVGKLLAARLQADGATGAS